MPAKSYQIPGGARVLLFTCEVCGGPAHFGRDVKLLVALRTGDAKREGEWYCGRIGAEPVCIAVDQHGEHGQAITVP